MLLPPSRFPMPLRPNKIRIVWGLVSLWVGLTHALALTVKWPDQTAPEQQVARSLRASIVQADYERMLGLWDVAGTARSAVEAMDNPSIETHYLVDDASGLLRSIIKLLMDTGWKQPLAMRLVNVRAGSGPGEFRALYRLTTSEGGLMYPEFTMRRNTAGQPVVVDLFDYANGWRAERMLRIYLVGQEPESDRRLTHIRKLIYPTKLEDRDVAKLEEAFVTFGMSNLAASRGIYLGMSTKLRALPIIQAWALYFTSGSGRDSFRKTVLGDINQHQQESGETSLCLSDIFIDAEDFFEADRVLERASQAMGVEESGILLIRAWTARKRGDLGTACSLAENAISVEPESDHAYSALMEFLAERGGYVRLIEVFGEFETSRQIRLRANKLREAPVFREFLESPIGSDWALTR